MKIFALELNNDIKGIAQRKEYIEALIADGSKTEAEQKVNDFFYGAYEAAFHVPVVYANSKGRLDHMSGKMGYMMEKAGIRAYERNKH